MAPSINRNSEYYGFLGFRREIRELAQPEGMGFLARKVNSHSSENCKEKMILMNPSELAEKFTKLEDKITNG